MDAAASANATIQAKYTKERKVGEGTYAVVYLGREIATGRKIAIKKIKIGQFKDGLDMSAIREVKFLKELNHPNVISLLDVFSAKTNLNLVLPFLPLDLEVLIKEESIMFQPADTKSYMLQTLRGLAYIHSSFLLHRDLKPNNLLLSPGGVVKIADFGLAREYADGGEMTNQVITRWYRPPELLLGTTSYSTAVDIWSMGCIFAELMLRVPLMAGDTDMNQLNTIFKALGTPTEAEWAGLSTLPGFFTFEQTPKTDLAAYFPACPREGIQLLNYLFKFDPRKRISAKAALQHPYFATEPKPTHPSRLPMPAPKKKADEEETKKEKRKRKAEMAENVKNVARKLDFTEIIA